MGGYSRSKPKPNNGEHIKDIISRTTCTKHNMRRGYPCFSVKFDTKDAYGYAICNDRVIKAGFVGEISSSSQSRSKRPDPKNSSSK